MKGKRLKNQEEEEFVPKAFKKDKALLVNTFDTAAYRTYFFGQLHVKPSDCVNYCSIPYRNYNAFAYNFIL